MVSLNERAWRRWEKAAEDRDHLNIDVLFLDCGSRVIDGGVNVAGGIGAGLAMAEVSGADLLDAQVEIGTLVDIPWPWVTTRSDRPFQACSLCQTALWNIRIGDFRAMGSGPACLLNQDLLSGRSTSFREQSDFAVLTLETRQLPDDDVCRSIANSCGVDPNHLAIFLAPTSSLAGSVQIAARSVETGMHKLHVLGFDLQKIVSGAGRCPIAAPSGDDFSSLGRTNDLMMFASQVWMAVRGITDADLANSLDKLPAATSPDYGLPFLELLKRAGGFYELDPSLFAPAEATMVNLDSGSVFHAGKIDISSLERVLKG